MANSQSVVNGTTVSVKPPPVDATSLPPASSPDLVLTSASSREYAQSTRLNAEEWKGPLPIDQYVDREKHLLNQNLTKNGGATGWILTSPHLPPNPDGTRQILASCESFLMHAYIARNGKLDKVISHGIGSVFTRPEHRGKGYANRMLTDLGKNLITYQQPNGDKSLFSVLYSDIGTKFYSRLGWKAFPSTHIHLAPMDQSTYESSRNGLPEVGDIVTEDLRRLPAISIVEDELVARSLQRQDTPFIAIRPSMDHFQWHHAREEFVSAKLGLSKPEVKGAIHRPTGVALVWTRVFPAEQKDRQLSILFTVIPPALKNSAEAMRALAALLLRAQREADEWGLLKGVEVWDPAELIIAAAQSLRTDVQDKVEVIYRDEHHVCSLRWTGARNQADDVVWDYKQTYAWC